MSSSISSLASRFTVSSLIPHKFDWICYYSLVEITMLVTNNTKTLSNLCKSMEFV